MWCWVAVVPLIITKGVLHSRAAPSVEAHHRVNGPDIGRNAKL